MSSPTTSEPEAYTVPEFAEALRCSQSYVYLQISQGRLNAVKLGTRTIILAPEKRRYVAALAPFVSRAKTA